MLKVSGLGKTPERATANSAGYDLFAYTPDEHIVIPPLGRVPVKTGIRVEFTSSEDFYLRIAPRSGLALKNGIDVFAGVVDKDYRGEIVVILFNSSDKAFLVKHEDKIAQMIIEKCYFTNVNVSKVEHLEETQRGYNGFGSSDYSKNQQINFVI